MTNVFVDTGRHANDDIRKKKIYAGWGSSGMASITLSGVEHLPVPKVTNTTKLDFAIFYHMEEVDSEGYSEIKYVDACNNCMDNGKTEALEDATRTLLDRLHGSTRSGIDSVKKRGKIEAFRALEIGEAKWCKEHIPRKGNDLTEEGLSL
jgi:hypothetical protein